MDYIKLSYMLYGFIIGAGLVSTALISIGKLSGIFRIDTHQKGMLLSWNYRKANKAILRQLFGWSARINTRRCLDQALDDELTSAERLQALPNDTIIVERFHDMLIEHYESIGYIFLMNSKPLRHMLSANFFQREREMIRELLDETKLSGMTIDINRGLAKIGF